MSKQLRVDTSLLKQLVAELDVLIASSQQMKEGAKADKTSMGKFIIEMQKAAGISSGIVAEATALIGDCTYECRAIQAPTEAFDSLESLLGLKGNPPGYGGSGGGSFN